MAETNLTAAPYRIVTSRLVLRCYDPADAERLDEAVDSSLDHLRPWMPWAQVASSLDETIATLRRFRAQFDTGENAIYGIFSPDESELWGGAGLHPRDAWGGGLEIGYWIRASRARAGLATEATATLTRVAIDLCRMDRVDIQVDPDNEASLAIPRKLGYREEATLRRRLAPFEPGGQRRDAVIFSLLAEELPDSAAAQVGYEAFDAAGRSLRAT